MHAVKPRAFFGRMKGRGVRVIGPVGLQSDTPYAKTMDHFIIVNAIGVCELDKTDSRPSGLIVKELSCCPLMKSINRWAVFANK